MSSSRTFEQDRSTGWRLGSNRNIQFRYQMIGIIMGAVLAVVMTRVFLEGYPILKENLFAHPELRETPEGSAWQSAMTFKFVGVLNTLAQDKSKTLGVMALGILIGVVIEIIRKMMKASQAYQAWKVKNPTNKTIDFVLDAFVVAENLTDREYQEALGYPSLGFTVRVGLRWNTGRP